MRLDKHKVAYGALVGALMLGYGPAVQAAEPEVRPTPPAPQPLLGSELVEPCAWPTTVQAGFGSGHLSSFECGATLIHPEVIAVYGATVEGATSFDRAELGDNVLDGPRQKVDPPFPGIGHIWDNCVVHPDGWIGFCRLAEPVNLPLNPIVYGCELDIVHYGREVAMAGFGLAQPPPDPEYDYDKRWALSKISALDESVVVVPDDGPVGCKQQDLGTPLYVEYPDGSWHIIGIAVETYDCAGTTSYRRLDPYVPWIEETLGVDVTPCHDSDGNWEPGEGCTNISMAGPESGGSWESWCTDIPTLALSETCGPGFGAASVEPSVVIGSPADQANFATGESVDIEISVNHPVSKVQIEIDNQLQASVDASWPYGFAGVVFPDGSHTLVAVGVGEDGVTRKSTPVQIHVGDTGDTGDAGDTGDTGEADTGTDTGFGATGDELDGGSDSCACQTEPERPLHLGWTALMLTMLIGVRRRP